MKSPLIMKLTNDDFSNSGIQIQLGWEREPECSPVLRDSKVEETTAKYLLQEPRKTLENDCIKNMTFIIFFITLFSCFSL